MKEGKLLVRCRPAPSAHLWGFAQSLLVLMSDAYMVGSVVFQGGGGVGSLTSGTGCRFCAGWFVRDTWH